MTTAIIIDKLKNIPLTLNEPDGIVNFKRSKRAVDHKWEAYPSNAIPIFLICPLSLDEILRKLILNAHFNHRIKRSIGQIDIESIPLFSKDGRPRYLNMRFVSLINKSCALVGYSSWEQKKITDEI
jgi:hypothetical protein